MQYGFIGLGNMASAIIKGMLQAQRFDPADIYGHTPRPGNAEALLNSTGIGFCSTQEELAAAVDVIVLAVKPQVLPSVLPGIAALPLDGKLVISIAAGKPLAFFEEALGHNTAIARVMPNINAKAGASTSAFTANSRVTEPQSAAIPSMFAAVGSIMEIPEHLFPIFSAVAGAAPAFCYMYIDALARAGVRGGMPRKLALEAAASTVLGSAKMVLESGEHPFALIDQVTSPGGTTIEGICALQRLGFESAVHQAVEAVVTKDKLL